MQRPSRMFLRHHSTCTKRMSLSTPPEFRHPPTIIAHWSYLSWPWQRWIHTALSARSFGLSHKSPPLWFPRWIVSDFNWRQRRWLGSTQGTKWRSQGCNQRYCLWVSRRWFRWRLGNPGRLPRTFRLFLGKCFSRIILRWSRGREVLRMLLAQMGELW